MAKIVRDDFEFKVQRASHEFTGEPVMQYSAHYTVESEGVEQKRGMSLEFSPQEETQIFNFIKNVVFPKVKEHEEIQ